MIATTPALLVHPDGRVDEIILNSRRPDQLSCISFHVDQARTYPLGRRAVVHAGRNRETVNSAAQQAWMSITDGSRPPILRGPVMITGPADRGGDFAPLPAPSAEAVLRTSRLLLDTFAAAPGVSAAQHQGGRAHQCDAYAIKRDKASGRWAFAVLDGVGDTDDARRFARRFAPYVARAAALYCDPARALAAARIQARDENRWDFDPATDPSAVAVVAVADQRSPLIRFAWCGDTRAYRLAPTGMAVPLTRDHNYAEELRARGRTPGPYDRNFITSCLMRGPIASGAVKRKYARRLLLCTDGVHVPLEERARGVEDILDFATDAKDAATMCVGDAMKAVGSDVPDNATALVVDFPQS
ncbi:MULTISPECIES: protein phosphatase 2C domain-containing protein [unclassified Streptomyces]|uniref:PP2C family protein-serine/threonine phosphatase n=1 Tax=unclassified Streptomyces TaxID=2593676 RepID=UPI002E11765B|nr:protein phosphatase 2C domain-containing protein [Streptomyces sp. NBC_01197]WSS49000.1 protein phosphatase 2C domain-containing protein [Streptomyces sp. NBC_01180]